MPEHPKKAHILTSYVGRIPMPIRIEDVSAADALARLTAFSGDVDGGSAKTIANFADPVDATNGRAVKSSDISAIIFDHNISATAPTKKLILAMQDETTFIIKADFKTTVLADLQTELNKAEPDIWVKILNGSGRDLVWFRHAKHCWHEVKAAI